MTFPELQGAGATLFEMLGLLIAVASRYRAWALGRGAQASVAVAHGLNGWGSGALEHRVSSWGAQASLLCGMWELPGPGIEPVSPALAGRFFSNEPPGKTKNRNFILITENFYISKGPLHNGLY